MIHFWLNSQEPPILKSMKHEKHRVFKLKSLQVWELRVLNVKRVKISIFFQKYRVLSQKLKNARFLQFSVELSTKKVRYHGSSWSVLHKHVGAKIIKNDTTKNRGSAALNVVSLHVIQTNACSAYTKNENLPQRLHVFQDL